MNSGSPSSYAARAGSAWTTLAVVAIGIAAFVGARSILAPLALSLFLTLLAVPVVRALAARRVPRLLAMALPLLGMLLAVVAALFLVGGALAEIQAAGPRYVRALEERLTYTLEWWAARGVDARSVLPSAGALREQIVVWATGTARGAIELVAQLVLVSVTTVFLLLELVRFEPRSSRLPAAVQTQLVRFLAVSSSVQRYLWIKTLMSVVVGLAAFAWVAALEVDLAMLFGLLAFALHFVPNLGAFLAAGPPMLLALVQYDPAKMLLVGLGYLAIGLVLGNLVEPALMGRRLGLSPLAVWLSLVLWGWLWGPLGMFLSVPITLAMKAWLEQSSEWSWIALLLEPSGAKPSSGEISGKGELSNPCLDGEAL